MSPSDPVREAWLSGDVGRCSGDVDPEQLWEAARGELSREDLTSLLDHVATCPACAQGWQLAKGVAAEAGPVAPVAATDRRRSRWPWAVAAAAAVVLAVVLVGVPIGNRPPEAFRDESRGPIQSRVAEDRPLSRADCRLSWEPGPEGTRYALEIASTEAGVLTVVEDLQRPEYRVPEELLAPLPSGARLLWRVTAVAPDGTTRTSVTLINALE